MTELIELDNRLESLTKRQREIYDFIADHIATNGYPPTVREIGTHFGIRSPNGVIANLRALQKKEVIEREESISRGIRLTGPKPPSYCPHCGRDVAATPEPQDEGK
jgi:repressor LexA